MVNKIIKIAILIVILGVIFNGPTSTTILMQSALQQMNNSIDSTYYIQTYNSLANFEIGLFIIGLLIIFKKELKTLFTKIKNNYKKGESK